MKKIFQLMTIAFLLAINPVKTQASSLQELCNEFSTRQVSHNITLTLMNSENVTRVLQTAEQINTWCLENFKYFTSFVNILEMPELKVASSGWEVFGAPISNTFLTFATAGITAVGVYLAYKEYRREELHQGLKDEIEILRVRMNDLELVKPRADQNTITNILGN